MSDALRDCAMGLDIIIVASSFAIAFSIFAVAGQLRDSLHEISRKLDDIKEEL